MVWTLDHCDTPMRVLCFSDQIPGQHMIIKYLSVYLTVMKFHFAFDLRQLWQYALNPSTSPRERVIYLYIQISNHQPRRRWMNPLFHATVVRLLCSTIGAMPKRAHAPIARIRTVHNTVILFRYVVVFSSSYVLITRQFTLQYFVLGVARLERAATAQEQHTHRHCNIISCTQPTAAAHFPWVAAIRCSRACISNSISVGTLAVARPGPGTCNLNARTRNTRHAREKSTQHMDGNSMHVCAHNKYAHPGMLLQLANDTQQVFRLLVPGARICTIAL